jgi:hypothetical protein
MKRTSLPLRRREFIAGLGAAAWPVVARAQQGERMPTIGWLHAGTREVEQDFIAPFRRGLSDSGGRNTVIEHGWGDGDFARRPMLIAEFIRRQVAVIVVSATQFAIEAKAATQTIPIVFLVGGDPVEFGLVDSFNHPGGNVTGIAMNSQGLVYAPLRDWSDLVKNEMALFPKGRYKDLTDSATQALKWMRVRGLIQRPEDIALLAEARREYRRRPVVLYRA